MNLPTPNVRKYNLVSPANTTKASKISNIRSYQTEQKLPQFAASENMISWETLFGGKELKGAISIQIGSNI